MDIKDVTGEEGRAALDLLENLSFQTQGTISGQHELLGNLLSFKAKLAAALAEENGEAETAPDG